ncbi:MAG: hypothetical protein ACJ786_28305 [Catenulispora sp.]
MIAEAEGPAIIPRLRMLLGSPDGRRAYGHTPDGQRQSAPWRRDEPNPG